MILNPLNKKDDILPLPSSFADSSPKLVQELNHRIKNNFQIIVSLMNLKKRTLPLDQWQDMRFMEEHIQSMAAAYRLVYASASMTHVSLRELIREVVVGLHRISGGAEQILLVQLAEVEGAIDLDHAIALALFLAVLLPPYLDEASISMGLVTVDARNTGEIVSLSIQRGNSRPIPTNPLRDSLITAFSSQLKGELVEDLNTLSLTFKLSLFPAPLQIFQRKITSPLSLNPGAEERDVGPDWR